MPLIMPNKGPRQSSSLNIMTPESDDHSARVHRIDQAIFESEQEIINGAEAVDAGVVFAELEIKYNLRV